MRQFKDSKGNLFSKNKNGTWLIFSPGMVSLASTEVDWKYIQDMEEFWDWKENYQHNPDC